MLFTLFIFATAVGLESIGTIVSVIGISALFGTNPIIMALAIMLDVAKIATVSFAYQHWKQLSRLMKSYALIAAAVTMTITSAGAAGYLAGEFQKAIIGTKEGELKVGVLKEQQAKYQERKKQIDDQIATLPAKTTVNQRLRLMNGFKVEQQRLDVQIGEIDKQLPEAQIKQIGTEAKAGPILYVAKAFDIPVEQAVKWVILMIIFVFDPLAVFLIIAGNFLWARRKQGHKDDVVAIPGAGHAGHRENHLVHRNMVMTPPPHPKVVPPPALPPEPEEPMIVTLQPTPMEEPMVSKSWLDDDGVRLPVPDEVPVIDTAIEAEPGVVEESGGLLRPVDVDAIPTGAKSPRQEITRSTLGTVVADPRTIVDAGRTNGFRPSARVITTPSKKLGM